jgi:hypothetical protein
MFRCRADELNRLPLQKVRHSMDCVVLGFLCSYVLGLVPIGYGIYVLIVGKAYLSSSSRVPLKGDFARAMGLIRIVAGIVYFVVITWAWSKAPS